MSISVSCPSFDIGESTTISIRASDYRVYASYTLRLKYIIGSAQGYIASNMSFRKQHVWRPDSDFLYGLIPNAQSIEGTIICEAYLNGVLKESVEDTFYVYAVKEDCVPDVSATIVDTNPSTIAVTGDSSKMVCYISKPKVTIDATPKNGASIKLVQAYNPVGLIATESPYTFDTVYSDEFRIKAVDSRGYVTEETYNTGFVLYDPAFFGPITISRTESTSTNATIQLSGYCFKGSFGAEDNTLTIKYRYKTSGAYGDYAILSDYTWNADGTFSAELPVSDLSLSETYVFEFVVEDKLTSFISDEVVLGQAVGDLRIAKDYIQTKNSIYAGDVNNTAWKCHGVRRRINGITYECNFGAGVVGSDGAAVIELYREDEHVGRIELRSDGHLYNLHSSMSLAEMMSSAPTNDYDNAQGHLIINGGSSNPVLIMWGIIYLTPSAANTPTPKRVNFNFGFLGKPFVDVGFLSSVPGQVSVAANNVSESGFDAVIDRINTVTTSVTWIAIGNGTNALPE